MKIYPVISPSFKASFVSEVPVKKYMAERNTYTQVPVSFVELSPAIDNDKVAMAGITDNWFNAFLIDTIYSDFMYDNQYNKYFAVTTQKDNFYKLDSEKILAVGEIRDTDINGSGYVEFVQANPECTDNPYSAYKKVGSAFLSGLKTVYNRIELQPISTDTVVNFYEKNGFRRDADDSNKFYWER